MKKFLVFAICMVLILPLMGCNSNTKGTTGKEETLLPFDLQFGDSYDVCTEKHEMPALEPASANSGYFCSPDYSVSPDNVFNGFTWSEDISTLFLLPMASYSFNEDKLLYEYYIIVTPSSEAEAERAFNAWANWLSEKLGIQAQYNEEADSLTARLETAELRVTVVLEQEADGDFLLYAVLHCRTYELQ